MTAMDKKTEGTFRAKILKGVSTLLCFAMLTYSVPLAFADSLGMEGQEPEPEAATSGAATADEQTPDEPAQREGEKPSSSSEEEADEKGANNEEESQDNSSQSTSSSEEGGASAAEDANDPVAAVGDCFVNISDEGRSIVYKVITDSTVVVGSGRTGFCDVINAEIDSKGEAVRYTTVTTSYSGVLTIPETVQYGGTVYTVKGINDNAFCYYSNDYGNSVKYKFSKIILPETVTSIGAGAFMQAALRSIEFSGADNVQSIGANAFEGASITSFHVSDNLTSLGEEVFKDSKLETITFSEDCQIKYIPNLAFYNSTLKSLSIPASVTSIGNSAFGKSDLTSIVIPSTVAALGSSVFVECARLASATIEEGLVDELPRNTFDSCTALKTFTFPSTIKSIEAYCFQKSGLTQVTIPKTLTYLGNYAFYKCGSLETVRFEEGHGMLSLSESVFSNCISLQECSLPHKLRTVGDNAFEQCSSLTQVSFPASITKLGAFAYSQCKGLETIVFEGDASAVSSETSTFYRCSGITSVVYRGKRSKTINYVSSIPTEYYTISFYSNQSGDELIGSVALPANSTPLDVTPGQIFTGDLDEAGTSSAVATATGAGEGQVIAAAPDGCKWWVETGFSLAKEMTDSFNVYGHPIASQLAVGDTFTAFTAEKVEVTYVVLALPEGNTPGKVAVGTSASVSSETAIDPSTAGAVTLTPQVTAPDANLYDVTAIASYAFSNCTRILTVTIPETVESVGAGAFYRCSTLSYIYFDGDASGISGNSVFTLCSNIKLVLYSSKKANLSFGSSSPDIYYTVFFYDSKHDWEIGNVEERVLVRARTTLSEASPTDIRSGTIPSLDLGYQWHFEDGFAWDEVLTDSCYAFQEGMGFKATIDILNGNVSKADCWFRAVSYDEATGEGVATVGLGIDGVAAIKTGLSGIPVIPSTVADEEGRVYTVKYVNDYAFGSGNRENACSLIGGIMLPSSIEQIDKGAFQNCVNLSTVSLPAGTKKVGEYAFAQCWSLQTATLNTALETIGDGAFYGCSALRAIKIPASTTEIGGFAFFGCTDLTSLAFADGSLLKSIGDQAFSTCNIKGILNLPDNLETVGYRSFWQNQYITTVTFPASFKSGGEECFSRCNSLETIAFMGNARKVTFGAKAFHLTFSVGKVTYYGKLSSVIFYGKKMPTICDYIETGTASEKNTDLNRSYRLYYNVSYYNSQSAFDEGDRLRRVLVAENAKVNKDIPSVGAGRIWRCEDGFALDMRATDSFYVIGGYDLSQATVTGVESTYSYTGGFITPTPAVWWLDGTRLVEGVDYVLDPVYGLFKNGYVNNYRMGRASIYLKGLGDYAGQKVVHFTILGTYDSEESMQVEFAGPNVYVYDGTAHCPAVKVTATLKGVSYDLVEGEDYTVSYRDNVNAGTGYVVVTGLYRFSGETSLGFTITPYPLEKCSVSSVEGSYIMVDGPVEPVPAVTSPLGETLRRGADFRLEYLNNGEAGMATVLIVGTGNYSGVLSGTFDILPGGGEQSGNGEGTSGGEGTGNGGTPTISGDGGGSSSGDNDGSSTTAPDKGDSAFSPQQAGGSYARQTSMAMGASGSSANTNQSYILHALGTAEQKQEEMRREDNLMYLLPFLFIALGVGIVYQRRRFTKLM